MDRSNTRNMRGGKARFIQRKPAKLNKAPKVKTGSTFAPKLPSARGKVKTKPSEIMLITRSAQADVARNCTADVPSECAAPTEPVESAQRPWCRCLLLMPGFEFYYLCYESEPGVICAPVLTGKDGRILYCTDSAKIPRMLAIGREDLAARGEPDLGEMDFVSVPDALDEYRDGIEVRECDSLFDVFDSLTELLAACGCPDDQSILSFLLNGFCNRLNTPNLMWDELAKAEGYRGLSLEEGIQLALGMVLTNGRFVA